MPLELDIQSLRRKLTPYFLSYELLLDKGRGAAFPVSPAAGWRFFRTDLGWRCYYDGAQWLTTHDYTLTILDWQSLGTVNIATSLRNVRNDYVPWPVRATIHTRVSTTNNATNFWTVALQGVNAAISAADTVYTISTASDAVGGVLRREGITTQALTNRDWFRLQTTKTLTPGALEVAAHLVYKLIVT
jgi:hypothetical protein